MNVKEFQEKLNEICTAAEQTDGVLTGAQMREFFAGMELDKQQLIQTLQYLRAKGITIEGMEAVSEAAENTSEAEEEVKKEVVPLTPEEEAYLKEYLAELEVGLKKDQSQTDLFQAFVQGKEGAKDALTQYYMPIAAEIAVELNCEEIFIADLIQEANLSLLMALGEAKLDGAENGVENIAVEGAVGAVTNSDTGADSDTGKALRFDNWLRKRVRDGVAAIIEEQTQRSIGDDMLVEKVQKLDEAIRELSEDEEDGQSPFTVGELAVILDMKVDEIKDILRLAGEEN